MSRRSIRLLLALGAALLAVSLAACGGTKFPAKEVDNEGGWLGIGNMSYQVQLSRELNAANVEDRSYLIGLPPSQVGLQPGQEWFGVWLQAQNQGPGSAQSARYFQIVDTQDNIYRPITLAASNVFAYRPRMLAHSGRIPQLDSAASYSPTQGALLLFKVDTSVYANRPLILEVVDAPSGGKVLGSVTLDL